MKQIIKYVSDTGIEFNTKKEVLAEDDLHKIQLWYEANKIYGSF